MTKVQTITLTTLLLIPIGYLLFKTNQKPVDKAEKVIRIPQLKIDSTQKSTDNPENILLKLKHAVKSSKSTIKKSKEEEAKEILATLAKNIPKREYSSTQQLGKPKPTIKAKRIVQTTKVHKKKPKKRPKIIKRKVSKPKIKIQNQQLSTNEDMRTMKFVKTLGVVEVSPAYEVANFEIPKKEELAREGIVNVGRASVETEALKKLDFVQTMGVVEISPKFETIEADKYLK